MCPMFALLTLAVLTTVAEEGGEGAEGFSQSVHIAPAGWALIFAGGFVALLLVTFAFRSQSKRH